MVWVTALMQIYKKLENINSKLVRAAFNFPLGRHSLNLENRSSASLDLDISEYQNSKLIEKELRLGNCVSGYVPYFPGQTAIYIYNFFARNYAIRQPILCRTAIFDINNKKHFERILVLEPNATILIDDLPEIAQGTVVSVQLISQKIRYNHGRYFGHLRFWGVYGDWAGVSHSMPTQGVFYLNKTNLVGKRRNYPIQSSGFTKNSIHYTALGYRKNFHTDGFGFKNAPLPLGFSSLKKLHDDQIVGVWHDGAFYSTKSNPIFCNQLVPLPPGDGISPILFFSEALLKGTHINIFLFNEHNALLDTLCVKEVDHSSEVDLEELFPDTLRQATFALLEIPSFMDAAASYVNILYKYGSDLCDSIHSQPCAPFDAEKGLFSSRKLKRSNALKFAPIPNYDSKKDFYWYVNNQTSGVVYKMRFVDDCQNEFVHVVRLSEPSIRRFDLKDFDVPFTPSLIQIESSDENVAASFFIIDHSKKTIAVDHFTGG